MLRQMIWFQNRALAMQSKVPTRHHTPDDDPVPGTLGSGEDICPDCSGTGKQVDKVTGKQSDQPCERCDGTGIIIEGIG
jgi:DnaJ-class molecular chaperone